jgi:DNA polymerase III sliding clamp (beta) subunit (PCNA family)
LIDYETFIKHAAKVTKTAPETRPVLRGVFHKEDGSAIVTDSHRLYVAKDVHSRGKGTVLSPDGEVIEGKYPDVTRIIPSDYRQTIEVDVRGLIKAIDCIYSPAKLLAEKVIIKFEDNTIQSHMPTYYKAKIQIPFRFEEHVSFNAKYLLDALKLFRAVGIEKAKIGFNGRIRPLAIENNDSSLLAIILPVLTL